MFSVTSSIPMQPKKKEKQNSFHVAWKDRLGLSQDWDDAIKDCRYAWGSDSFFVHLDFLIHSIVNIKDGPQLYDLIIEEKNNLDEREEEYIDKYIRSNIERAENPSFVNDERKRIHREAAKMLFHFIIQTLEDHNFGFYKSEYSGEYDEIK